MFGHNALKAPKPRYEELITWTTDEVLCWLKQNRLEEFNTFFASERIDGLALIHLDKQWISNCKGVSKNKKETLMKILKEYEKDFKRPKAKTRKFQKADEKAIAPPPKCQDLPPPLFPRTVVEAEYSEDSDSDEWEEEDDDDPTAIYDNDPISKIQSLNVNSIEVGEEEESDEDYMKSEKHSSLPTHIDEEVYEEPEVPTTRSRNERLPPPPIPPMPIPQRDSPAPPPTTGVPGRRGVVPPTPILVPSPPQCSTPAAKPSRVMPPCPSPPCQSPPAEEEDFYEEADAPPVSSGRTVSPLPQIPAPNDFMYEPVESNHKETMKLPMPPDTRKVAKSTPVSDATEDFYAETEEYLQGVSKVEISAPPVPSRTSGQKKTSPPKDEPTVNRNILRKTKKNKKEIEIKKQEDDEYVVADNQEPNGETYEENEDIPPPKPDPLEGDILLTSEPNRPGNVVDSVAVKGHKSKLHKVHTSFTHATSVKKEQQNNAEQTNTEKEQTSVSPCRKIKKQTRQPPPSLAVSTPCEEPSPVQPKKIQEREQPVAPAKQTAALTSVPSPTPDPNDVSSQAWYFGDYGRTEANEVLKKSKTHGTFLIRKSEKSGQPYTLCILYKEDICNIPVRKRTDGKYALGTEKAEEHVFDSVNDLVRFHTNNPIEVAKSGVIGKVKLLSVAQKL